MVYRLPRSRHRWRAGNAPASPRKGALLGTVPLNDRQRQVINRLWSGFEGKLTTSKYAALTKCSQDTAHRDVLALVAHGVLTQNPEGGRSTSYALAPVR